MKRTKHPTPDKVSLILTGDWHLREDQPVCRTDDFWEAQWKKVKIIQNLQTKYNCPVLHAGDLFNHWKPSPYLLRQIIFPLSLMTKYGYSEGEGVPSPAFWTIYGNHDLPQHNLDLAHKCGIAPLVESSMLQVLKETHWQMSPSGNYLRFHTKEVLLWHIMTYIGESPWPGCDDPTAEQLLDRYPDYDLIVTGHNHKSFTFQKDGRLLVNPGIITRQTAAEADYRPCVYLWTAETNTVIPYFLPINKDVISREHIERKEERDARIEAFVERLNTEFESVVDFRENLERFVGENEVRTSVMEIIREAIGQ